MANLIVINGVSVDLDEPCAVVAALKRAEMEITLGGGVIAARFEDHEVSWTAANLSRLQDMIADYERKCAAAQGLRTRYAKRLRFVR
ncbi:gpW family head-tail joining protein [Rhodopseudomonas palustris]|uniref:gpW family head-tail joining protein n=1 Tax=Rhodopseudomonas palustris TaxID=1076 RepID=UPI000CECADF7|nr:gpW family head-tail joining protein [Rhodopseudomonas palustris]AVT76629.1 hypothetical protein RPPS3_25660 [Rhodopseudomonas palustris]PPQ42158.1 hypothetical protein CKO39_18380 [Rhodopseudomonas palustris]